MSIVETLKEFRNILLGQKIKVHTDHKNILYNNFSNSRIARWRLILEEFSPEYVHISGKDNVVADALSRMETDDFSMEAWEQINTADKAKSCACVLSSLTRDESVVIPEAWDSIGMAESIMASADAISEKFPLKPSLIEKCQKKDRKLLQKIKGEKYGTTQLEGAELITYEGKIVVPHALQGRIVAWYHEYLIHPGSKRLEKPFNKHFGGLA